MGTGHGSRGREGPFCVKAKEGARHGGQEQVPTAQQSPHVANALGRRAQDPGVELWQGGSCVILSLLLGGCSCLHSAESTWPLGQSSWALDSTVTLKPEATVGQSHRVFVLYKVTATLCLSTTTVGRRLGPVDTL